MTDVDVCTTPSESVNNTIDTADGAANTGMALAFFSFATPDPTCLNNEE